MKLFERHRLMHRRFVINPVFRMVGLFAIMVLSGCAEKPATKIIHILNWHFVSREDFANDLRNQSHEITDDEIDRRYSEFLDDVESVQTEQMMLLRGLIREHGIRKVFLEGVSESNVEKFRLAVEAMPEIDIPKLHRRMLESDDLAEQALLLVTIDEHRAKKLELGAVGALMVTDDLVDVLPLEDDELMNAANPASNGFVFDGAANEERERAMVQRLVTGRPVSVVILGGGHDLRDDLERACPECSLQVIEPEAYRRAAAR